MSRAAARSAVPLASVSRASTMSPLRFSVSRWPMWQSFASFPAPLRNSRASGSVVEKCVSFLRFSPRKLRSALRPPLRAPPPDGGPSLPSLGTKLFMLAQASISVPSTEKCSLESRPRTCGRFRTLLMNLRAISPSNRRSRFLQKTVASQNHVVHRQADEPAEQKIVFELLHQQAFRTHGIERLEQKRSQQPFRRDRRPALSRIKLAESRRQLQQGF